MKDFVRGASRVLGVVVGFLPIAMSFGAVSVQAGISDAATVGMSVFVFAGAAQFAIVEAVRQHLPWFSIVLTALIINLRHIPMSLAAVHNLYNRFEWPKRWLLAQGLIDETFALEMSDQAEPFGYYLGMRFCCWMSWITGTWLGSQLGMQIPERWLQFALPGLFLCLLTSSVSQRWGRQVLVVLGIGIALVVATQAWGSTGTLLAIVGVAVAATLLLGTQTATE
ncbi:MAG TPA: AzlC family ABC transporter permease, partial [Crinalium sp.]